MNAWASIYAHIDMYTYRNALISAMSFTHTRYTIYSIWLYGYTMRTCMHRCRLLSFFPSWNCWLLLLFCFLKLRDESRETERKSQRAKWERLRESAHTIIQDIEEKSLGNGFGIGWIEAINDYIEPNANIDKYEIKWGKPNFPSRREERLIFYFFSSVGRVLLLLLLYVGCCCCACVVFFFLRAALLLLCMSSE